MPQQQNQRRYANSLEQDLVLRPLAQPIIFQKGFLQKRGRQMSPGANKLIKFVKGIIVEELHRK